MTPRGPADMATRNASLAHPRGSFLLAWIVLLTCGIPALSSDPPVPSSPVPRSSVLLLTIDSLRPDHLGCYGYGKPTSPWIDRLAREGVRFENAVAQGGWTSPAMASILTGLYPSVHGVQGRLDAFPCTRQAPLTAWRDAGYRIPASPLLCKETNYSRLGFHPDPEYDHTPEALFAWVRKHRDHPFFCWVHINKTPHLPYNPTEAYRTLFLPPEGLHLTPDQEERLEVVRTKVIIPSGTVPFTDGDLAGLLPLYDGEVRHADDAVGRIYEFLTQEGLLDSTVIILTADHGDELLERGSVGHASTSWAGTLYQEIVHVPLIVRYPAVLTPGTVVRPIVEGLDLLPTLHAMFGIVSPIPLQGKSLLPLLKGDPTGWPDTALSETTPCGYQCARVQGKADIRLHALRSGPWKLLATHTPQRTSFALHNLESDPAEREDFVERRPDIASRLKDHLLRQEYLNRIHREKLLQDCSCGTDEP